MFTGIVEELGTVSSIEREGDRARLHLTATKVLEDSSLGDSISVEGCCLTIAAFTTDGFRADLMAETLRATSLGELSPGAPVNLERAMPADGRLGGHIVQGHVDAVATVVQREEQPGTVTLTLSLPEGLARYLVPKGSVTLAGVSLTVVDLVGDDGFRVALIPHTCEVTTLGELTVGDRVNVEVDVLAKYVERLLEAGTSSPYVGTTLDQGAQR